MLEAETLWNQDAHPMEQRLCSFELSGLFYGCFINQKDTKCRIRENRISEPAGGLNSLYYLQTGLFHLPLLLCSRMNLVTVGAGGGGGGGSVHTICSHTWVCLGYCCLQSFSVLGFCPYPLHISPHSPVHSAMPPHPPESCPARSRHCSLRPARNKCACGLEPERQHLR